MRVDSTEGRAAEPELVVCCRCGVWVAILTSAASATHNKGQPCLSYLVPVLVELFNATMVLEKLHRVFAACPAQFRRRSHTAAVMRPVRCRDVSEPLVAKCRGALFALRGFTLSGRPLPTSTETIGLLHPARPNLTPPRDFCPSSHYTERPPIDECEFVAARGRWSLLQRSYIH